MKSSKKGVSTHAIKRNFTECYQNFSIFDVTTRSLDVPYYYQKNAWRQVYEAGNNQALITMTGLDFETFYLIKSEFKFFCGNYSGCCKDGVIFALQHDEHVWTGCPRLMSAGGGLSLVLKWTRTCGSTMMLQLIFGMIQ